jgi:hypothetical protein
MLFCEILAVQVFAAPSALVKDSVSDIIRDDARASDLAFRTGTVAQFPPGVKWFRQYDAQCDR